MCSPVAAIGAFAGSQGLGLFGQSQAAKGANKQAQYNFKLTTQFAQQAAVQNYKSIGQRQLQEEAATSSALQQLAREARSARGTALASAGESGVSGAAINALDDLYLRNLLENQIALKESRRASSFQLQAQALGIQQQGQAQILSALPGKAPMPNAFDFLKAGLDTAAFGFSLGGTK